MRELVLILADLYPPPERARTLPAAEMPAFAGLLRFAGARRLSADWRAWLCAYVGRPDLMGAPPATLAAAELAAGGGGSLDAGATVWLAEPVRYEAGLAHARLAARALVPLEPEERAALAADFARVFGGEGLALLPLPSRGFLMRGIAAEAGGGDPARYLGADLRETPAAAAPARELRLLSSEIEMWLHDHPVNSSRARCGAAPVSGLWLWGAGRVGAQTRHQPMPLGFGTDPSLGGLWSLCGSRPQPLPPSLELAPESGAAPRSRAVAVLYVSMLSGGFAELEGNWLSRALSGLGRGDFSIVRLIANDRVFECRPRDRLRFWRRERGSLERLS